MLKSEPRISDYMVKAPKCIDADAPLRDALRVMQGSNVRYLPVMVGQQVVGILKDNAAKTAVGMLGSEEFTAADLMHPRPQVTRPDTGLYEVLGDTPNNTYGCTVVQSADGKIVGLFTPREAMNVVHALAREGREGRRAAC